MSTPALLTSKVGYRTLFFTILIAILAIGCKKTKTDNPTSATDTSLAFTVNGVYNGTLSYNNLGSKPTIKFTFADAINPSTVADGIKLTDASGTSISITTTLGDANKTITVIPSGDLSSFSTYTLSANSSIKSSSNGRLVNPVNISLTIGITMVDKFPAISDEALLDLVQKQTIKYFYDFGHPVSGLARERSTSGETVTTGGSGFGIMAIITGIHRGFISRADGLARISKIATFLDTKAERFHGAFSHWLDGTTGKTLPFSANDNGADLVETAHLIQGLLTARQYFNGADATETALRTTINAIYDGVDWNWFRNGGQDVMYWHWSPDKGWALNLKISGWNEALMVYVLAASAKVPVPASVYHNGWARNGAMKNGNSYYGFQLPLGVANGGPLFISQYSFLGINPNGLTDTYGNYETQTKNHTLINRAYCIANPKGFVGYSADCWGLTASDTYGNSYTASSPSNDVGTIAPTAAISSMPYTPAESMQALKFFYYKLGDKAWGNYGFTDAFNLSQNWFDNQTLAIDQGPIVVMIENYRSKLLWNLFMSCPEIKTGMKGLGFNSPNL